MNLNKFLIFTIIVFCLFLFGCSDNEATNINLNETSSVDEIEFENLENIKELTKDIVNKHTMENDLEKLSNYFLSVQDSFDSEIYNSSFNLKNEEVLNSFKRDYLISNYNIVDVFYDSLSEKGILKLTYLVKSERNYSEYFQNVVLTSEYDVYVFEYSLEKNKITDFNYYTRE